MSSKSVKPSLPSPSRSASSMTLSHTSTTSSSSSSDLVSRASVSSKSSLQMKLSVLKSVWLGGVNRDGQDRAESLQGLRGGRCPVQYCPFLPADHTDFSTSLRSPQSISDKRGSLKPTGSHTRHMLNIHSQQTNTWGNPQNPTRRVHTATAQTVPNLKHPKNFPLKPNSPHSGLLKLRKPGPREAKCLSPSQRSSQRHSKDSDWVHLTLRPTLSKWCLITAGRPPDIHD